jgi:hypothetical protein
VGDDPRPAIGAVFKVSADIFEVLPVGFIICSRQPSGLEKVVDLVVVQM